MTAAFIVKIQSRGGKKWMHEMWCKGGGEQDVVCPVRESEVREGRRGLEHTQTDHCLRPPPPLHMIGFTDSDLPRGQAHTPLSGKAAYLTS